MKSNEIINVFHCALISVLIFVFLALTAYAQSPLPVTKLGADIEIREIQSGTYVVTHRFPWAANSMFVLIGDHDLIFVDTPYTPEAANLVLDWIIETFGQRDIIEINTGFHSESVEIIFPGETHTPDNTVVYFPQRKILFGGCMILAGNGTGNTADANLKTWKDAVTRLQSLDCDIVVPGHGLRFDAGLIQNTITILP